MKPTNSLIILIIICISIFLGLKFWSQSKESEQVFCTQEAKLCPDGSYVGRSGPKCEFTACPKADSSQKTFLDKATGISFSYPATLDTKYIIPVDWPPQIEVLNKKFSCTQGGSEIMPNGQTQRRIISGTTYCVTKASEGAAGSIYTKYSYAFSHNSKTIIFNFTLRSVQCANYDDPQKTACEKERDAFNIDSILDQIAGSISP